LLSIAHDADLLRGDVVDDGERVRGFRRAGTGDNNFRVGNPGRPESFYAVLVDKETFEVQGVEAPPRIGASYPVDDTEDGFKRVYPIGEDGAERVWTLSYDGAQEALTRKAIISSEGFVIKRIYQDKDRRLLLPSIWQGPQYNATTGGTNLLTDMFGAAGKFSYPKSIGTMERILDATTYGLEVSLTIDLFGGSGTTAHAAVNRARTKGGIHKYVIVEMGQHADSVIKDRIVKAVYSARWGGGKPVDRLGGTSHFLKCISLESYEDSLNNVALSRSTQQQAVMDFTSAQGTDGLREQYVLRYQLDVESQGSASLLDIAAFSDPVAYKLLVKTPGSDESREVNVDLLETFNWLLGLTVQHIAAPRSFAAAFERDGEGRLQLKGRLKQDAAGPWWFRTVTGTTPEGRKTLVIWRKLTGDAEQDNLVLETWFRDKQAYSVRDTEFDLIYVNGDSTLENLRTDEETWKVRLIEEDFQRLMFEGTEA
jgi:adenine-specific DNA-methyltransferase